MSILEFTVPPSCDGRTVQTFLRQECGLSWRMVVKLKTIPDGICADGERRRTIDPVHAGQTLRLHLPDDTIRVTPVWMPLDIVFEDTWTLVVNKPPYLAVHPSAGKPAPTLASGVVAHFEAAGTPLAFRPLNRLDRNTSGLLLAAKHAHAAYALRGTVQKVYYALALGTLTGSGTIDAPIRVKEGCTITREVGEGGKPSVTHWTALATDGTVTLLHVVIDTGRTHQIRVHMAHLGHPLAGDTLYGTDDTVMPRQALHCGELCFVHPLTGETHRLYRPLPADMARVALARGLCPPGTSRQWLANPKISAVPADRSRRQPLPPVPDKIP